MRIFILFCFLFTLVLMDVPSSNAQSNKYDGPEFSAREVAKWKADAEDAQKKFERFRDDMFKALRADDASALKRAIREARVFYPMRENYSPFSDRVIEKLTKLAYTVDQSDNYQEVSAAKLEYDSLIKEHILDVDVLLFASEMARANYKFGDPKDYRKIIDATAEILNSFLERSGTTPDWAYTVITNSEEAYMLAKRRWKAQRSELFHVNGRYYNVHYVTDAEGNSLEVYFDVSICIKNMQMQAFIASKQVSPTTLRIFQ